MTRILTIGLGGTIGSVKKDSIALDGNTLKILDCVHYDDVELVRDSPFSVLSENMTVELWKKLISYIDSIDFNSFDGVIILHGSDTLAYTSSLIANAFPDKSIVLTASDKPIEDENSNGIENFDCAVRALKQGVQYPVVSYDGLFRADCITSADVQDKFVSVDKTLPPLNSKVIYDKNILLINAYVGIDAKNYNFENVDAVLVNMYHSATVPSEFAKELEKTGKPVYYVTHKPSADYESTAGIKNIIKNCIAENAYARILLTNGNLMI